MKYEKTAKFKSTATGSVDDTGKYNYPPGANIQEAVKTVLVDGREILYVGLVGNDFLQPGGQKRVRVAPRINTQWFNGSSAQIRSESLLRVMEELSNTEQVHAAYHNGQVRIYCDIALVDRMVLFAAIAYLERELGQMFPKAKGWDLFIKRWPSVK